MENGETLSGTAGNWLKGALVRAYTAQRDHFLELHARKELSRGRPADKEGDADRRASRPRSTER